MVSVEFWRMGATPVPSARDRSVRARVRSRRVGRVRGRRGARAASGPVHRPRDAAARPPRRSDSAPRSPFLFVRRCSRRARWRRCTASTGGRASFSIGRGDGAVKVLKRKPMRVAEFEAYLTKLQAYLRGEDVEVDGVTDLDGSRIRHRSVAANPQADDRRRRDGAANDRGRGEDGGRRQLLRRRRRRASAAEASSSVRDACNRIGRDFESLRLGCYLQVAVTDEDPSAREAIRGLVVTHARFSGWEPRPAADVSTKRTRRTVTPWRRWSRSTTRRAAASRSGRAGELGRSISTPTRPAATSSSTSSRSLDHAEYCAERLQEIIDLGITRLMIGTRAVGVDLDESNAMRIGREVLPLLRR